VWFLQRQERVAVQKNPQARAEKAISMSQIATEAGHWYTLTGEPAYEVVGKSGDLRPTTLRDARKLGLVPSVTTIIKCADAPALNKWMRDQVLMAALTLPKIDGESMEAYAQRIMDDSRQQAATARDIGTAIHGQIEQALCLRPVMEHHDQVRSACKSLIDWCGSIDEIRPERSFAHPLGYGGKCDVHKKPSIDLNETHNGFVADFKSKDFTADKLPGVYENHSMQLAAYREGFEMPLARCAIIYVSTSVPGLTHLVEVDEAELARGWNMFCALLRYWQLKNNYVPQERIAA
jgi:hypothetical protein